MYFRLGIIKISYHRKSYMLVQVLMMRCSVRKKRLKIRKNCKYFVMISTKTQWNVNGRSGTCLSVSKLTKP